MTVVVELEGNKKVRVYTKGASENIVDDCSNIIERNGEIKELDMDARQNLKETILKGMAVKSLRTIAIGYKDIFFEEFKAQLAILE